MPRPRERQVSMADEMNVDELHVDPNLCILDWYNSDLNLQIGEDGYVKLF